MESELALELGDQLVARIGTLTHTSVPGLGDQPVDLVDPLDRDLLERPVGMAGEDDDRVVGGGHGERSVDPQPARGRAVDLKCAILR